LSYHRAQLRFSQRALRSQGLWSDILIYSFPDDRVVADVDAGRNSSQAARLGVLAPGLHLFLRFEIFEFGNQMRLSFAAEYLMRLSDKHFPNNPHLARRHNEVMKKLNLSATPLSDHDGFLPRELSDGEANVLSREILSIYIDLIRGI
jgi:hypothetical protein